ncbi:MAG: lipocalin-like domain-containing protein [Rhodocyclaceae bacterium]|nr:lipocalin-like domain-containing protein [Rhodocyclaceae bacterium]
MSRFKWFAGLVLFLAAVQSVFAAGPAEIQGTWKLVSYEVEVQATGDKFPPMGKNPSGYVTFTPEMRVFFVFTGDGRKPGKTAEEKADLLKSLIAYTGAYRVEDGNWITQVEVAWDPAWVGTEQKRAFTIEGNHLQVLTPWRVMPNWADKGMTRSIITFERSK